MSTQEEVKTLLSSLIISSVNGLSVKRLYQDYRSEIGKEIPYREYGCPTFEDFLRSIPDICTVHGTGPFALIIPVVSEKVKHINDMVLRQKLPKANKRGARFRRTRGSNSLSLMVELPSFREVPVQGMPPPEYYLDQKKKRNHYDSYKMKNPNINQGIHQQLCCSKNFNQDNSIPHLNYTVSNDPVDKNNKYEHIVNKCESKLQDTACAINKKSSSFPVVEESEINITSTSNDDYCSELDFSDNSFDDYIYVSDEDSNSSFNYKKYEVDIKNVLEPEKSHVSSRVHADVKNNLRFLITDNPSGIWCSKLPHFYRQQFGVDLDPTDFGFTSISTMCEDLSDIFHLIRPGKTDWKVFDKRKPKPEASDVAEWCDYIKKFIPSKQPTTNEDPFPTEILNYKKSHTIQYPRDVLELGETIEMQWISSSHMLDDYIAIIIAEVYDPSKFWIQLKSEVEKIDELMNELQVFYGRNFQEYKMDKKYACKGLYCAATFFNDYHRALILKTFADNTIKVFYIDYGTVADIQLSNVCFLHQQFSYLPRQAIRARLSNIIPAEQNKMWSRDASNSFLNLIKEKDLVGYLTHIDDENRTLSFIVTDVTEENIDIHINDRLVDDGYAIIGNKAPICPTSKAIVPNIHLYPTFDEIEGGSCPTVADLIKFKKLDISLENIFINYFSSINTQLNCPEEVIISDTSSIDSESTNQVESYPDLNNYVDDNNPEILSNTNTAISIMNELPNKPVLNKVEKSSISVEKELKPPPGFETVTPNFKKTNNIQNAFLGRIEYRDHLFLNEITESDLNKNNKITEAPSIESLNTSLNCIQSYLLTIKNKCAPRDIIITHKILTDCDKIIKLLKNKTLQFSEKLQLRNAYIEKIKIVESLLVNQSKPVLNEEPKLNSNVHLFKKPEGSINYKEDQNIEEKLLQDKKSTVDNSVIFDITTESFKIHVIKVDGEFYVSSQEIITNILESPLLFFTWFKTNCHQPDTFPTKVINLLNYRKVYNQIIKYNIPGVLPANNLGCNVRLTQLRDVPSIIGIYGEKEKLDIIRKTISLIMHNDNQ